MHAQKLVANNLCVAHGIRMLRKTKIQAAVSCTFGKIGRGSAQIGREIYYGGSARFGNAITPYTYGSRRTRGRRRGLHDV